MYWFVYFGDCLTPFRCEAADRVEALALFRDAFPGVPALCAVPANEFGGQVHHGIRLVLAKDPLGFGAVADVDLLESITLAGAAFGE